MPQTASTGLTPKASAAEGRSPPSPSGDSANAANESRLRTRPSSSIGTARWTSVFQRGSRGQSAFRDERDHHRLPGRVDQRGEKRSVIPNASSAYMKATCRRGMCSFARSSARRRAAQSTRRENDDRACGAPGEVVLHQARDQDDVERGPERQTMTTRSSVPHSHATLAHVAQALADASRIDRAVGRGRPRPRGGPSSVWRARRARTTTRRRGTPHRCRTPAMSRRRARDRPARNASGAR